MNLRNLPARLGLLLGLAVLLWSACGDEETDRQFTVRVTVSEEVLSFDGSETARVNVSVLDQNGQPPEAGGRVVLFALNTASGERTGVFSNEDNQVILFLDAFGTAPTATFACSEEASVLVVAQLESGENGSAAIDCSDVWPGDWEIVSLSADRLAVRPSQTAELTAEAIQGDGTSVPAGTQIRFAVSSEVSSGFGGSRESSTVRGTRDGTVRVTLVAGTLDEDVTITASFDNPRQGESTESTVVLVRSNAPDEPGIELSAEEDTLPADGDSTTTITALVFREGGAPQPAGTPVVFTTDKGLLMDAEGDLSTEHVVNTDADGRSRVTFMAGNEAGLAMVTGWVSSDVVGTSDPLVDEQVITLFDVGSIEYIGAEELPLGIRGSGVNESTEVCFRVETSEGDAFPEGYVVDFEVTSTSSGAGVTSDTASTDAAGEACANVFSGTTSGVIQVEACVSVGLVEECSSSGDVPVVGVTPSRRGMSLTCNHWNIGALRYRSGETISRPSTGSLCTTCSLTLRDRDGNAVGFERQVTFRAESGSFVPSAQVTNGVDGVASVEWCADGTVPADVLPFAGEPSWEDADPLFTANPRDGVVTLIAYMAGEEEFEDVNRNGQWDETAQAGEDPTLFPETFVDQSEPFVDANDNDLFDTDLAQEVHVDVEGGDRVNGVFDQGNLRWDDNTTIWVQTRVALTGSPEFREFDGVNASWDLEDDLPLDKSYPETPTLSHWFVPSDAPIRAGNYYEGPELPQCVTGLEDYCLELPTYESATTFDLYYVARDENGNPMNPSLGSFTYAFDQPEQCGPALGVSPQSLSPSGERRPFTFEINTENVPPDPDYVLRYVTSISDFVAGSSQRFIVTHRGSLGTTRCRLRMEAPLNACSDCGDPADDLGADWPYLVIYEAPSTE